MTGRTRRDSKAHETADFGELRAGAGDGVGIRGAGGVRRGFAESALLLLRRARPRARSLAARRGDGLQRAARGRARRRARHGALAPGHRGPLALVDLGSHAAGRCLPRAAGGDASRLRSDSRRETATSGASRRRRRRASGRFATTPRATPSWRKATSACRFPTASISWAAAARRSR